MSNKTKKNIVNKNIVNKNKNNNNKGNTTKKTKKHLQHCSPHINSTGVSCFDKEALHKITKLWNKSHTDKITIGRKSNKTLWKEINNKMSMTYKCEDGAEWCWLEQPFIKNTSIGDELDDFLKPLMPKKWEYNPREWLNTLDIEEVLNRYQQKHDDFFFAGAVPIDFDKKFSNGQCVSNELCNIDLSKLWKDKKRRIGAVFNLDKHNQSGSHWIALFCDLNNKHVSYWDSYAVEPPNEVVELMDKLEHQADKLGIKLERNVNDVRHQYKNTECGIYSIYFIISLLEGKNVRNVYNKIMDDDKIWKKRKEFFIKT
jgi:hypothetical protein